MKFLVLVGREFPCHAAEEITAPVVVNVIQNVPISLPNEIREQPQKQRSILWYGGVSLGCLIGIGLIAAVLLGVATGDYTSLRLLADGIKDFLLLGIKVLKSP
jgi:hypothetical protein